MCSTAPDRIRTYLEFIEKNPDSSNKELYDLLGFPFESSTGFNQQLTHFLEQHALRLTSSMQKKANKS